MCERGLGDSVHEQALELWGESSIKLEMTVSWVWDKLIKFFPSHPLGRKILRLSCKGIHGNTLRIIMGFCKMCFWWLECWFTLRDMGQIRAFIWIYVSSSWSKSLVFFTKKEYDEFYDLHLYSINLVSVMW